jgi:hypothetical protein
MPSPVTMPALVFCRYTRPAPPVHSTTARQRKQHQAPLAISMASTPQTRPSSTSRSATKNSS